MSDQTTSAQFRAARALLDWSVISLAEAARVSISTVVSVERRNPERVLTKHEGAIRAAMEAAGVQFIDDDGEGMGVRLRPRLDLRRDATPAIGEG